MCTQLLVGYDYPTNYSNNARYNNTTYVNIRHMFIAVNNGTHRFLSQQMEVRGALSRDTKSNQIEPLCGHRVWKLCFVRKWTKW